MPKEKPIEEKPKFVHEGRSIFLVGKAGENGIVPFQHMFGDGHSETVGLRLNTAYVVGGKDAAGNTIKDWVYESFALSEYNNMRVKTNAEKELDAHEAIGGVIKAKSGEIMD